MEILTVAKFFGRLQSSKCLFSTKDVGTFAFSINFLSLPKSLDGNISNLCVLRADERNCYSVILISINSKDSYAFRFSFSFSVAQITVVVFQELELTDSINIRIYFVTSFRLVFTPLGLVDSASNWERGIRRFKSRAGVKVFF